MEQKYHLFFCRLRRIIHILLPHVPGWLEESLVLEIHPWKNMAYIDWVDGSDELQASTVATSAYLSLAVLTGIPPKR